MSQDVAGATFMAAGSSAPELATAVIGVFIAKDDIGISGVIGSAVFNIMFVISVCALFSGTVIYLNWWPLVRDCIAYLVAIFALLFTIYNEVVTWYFSPILSFLFNCLFILFNSLFILFILSNSRFILLILLKILFSSIYYSKKRIILSNIRFILLILLKILFSNIYLNKKKKMM